MSCLKTSISMENVIVVGNRLRNFESNYPTKLHREFWPMESRNLCGKNVAKFRNLLAGSPSQEKLAAKMQLEGLNINKNAIQRIECGKRMVKDIELDVFAKIFHVSVDELMYGPKEDR